jgi:hypothetical protein
MASPPTEIADTVQAAVLGVPGVAGMHGGAFGEAATYLPGRTVKGVQLRAGEAIVHIILAWEAPAQKTAERVRAVVTAITHTRVDVVVEDVAAPLGRTVSAES